jgi:hypothetical protein
MYYSYVEIEYVATIFSPARTDLALKLLKKKYQHTTINMDGNGIGRWRRGGGVWRWSWAPVEDCSGGVGQQGRQKNRRWRQCLWAYYNSFGISVGEDGKRGHVQCKGRMLTVMARRR